ncbi:MAG TPA: alpha-amylase family glycosyl hydrolase [Burkholderiales bacterium]|nr:alpha-amylase family glycosyl hydrolase [Burkholderiales bacterium]
MRHAFDMPFGAAPRGEGAFHFRFWAPGEARITLETESVTAPMQRHANGWHVGTVPARAGETYRYRLSDGVLVPDPASRFNPEDVHGPSELIDPRGYEWQQAGWRGRPWAEAVVYEMHVGAFTPEGTFAAARGRLAGLAELGVTAIELMPVADFAGARNWGYDGVLPFAPDASYGRPEDLKALVDEAHRLGLMVLLDVVYNHFGPDGNYLHAYCPQFFNPERATPWGDAINFDGPESFTVRAFYRSNALYWLEEYQLDGLRLDAVHALHDDSRTHIVDEIAAAVRAGPGRRRHVHLVLENERNDARFPSKDRLRQWNDPLHHALHVRLTGESDGYYAPFAAAPLERLGESLAAPAGLPPGSFVAFLQNHDQVGNRAHGERLHALADAGRERAALACVLLSPQVPMLFMGEEWAASTPFLYFCDFGGELAKAVREGRRTEFARFAAFADAKARARIPDPNDPATFRRSKLAWAERSRGAHAERLALVRELLAIRRTQLVPRLAGARRGQAEIDGAALRVRWRLGDGALLTLALDDGVSAPGEMLYRAEGVQVTLQAP